MSTPAAKRRRMEVASSTLSKPFRSPFKTPFKSPLKAATTDSNTESTSTSAAANTGSSTTNINSKMTAPNSTPLEPSPLPGQTSNFALLASSKTPLQNPSPLSSTPSSRVSSKKLISPISAVTLNSDPDIVPLLRVQRELEKQLREVKEELEIAEQARKIEYESAKWTRRDGDGEGEDEIDGELVELIEKWRGASRLAAEELFGMVRDRVNRMGGPRAWKEQQKRQAEFQNTWDQDEQLNGNDNDNEEDGEKNDAETRDIYAEYDVDPETVNEKGQREKGVGDTGELPGQEDEFTMAMMLRTLNVDLDTIGYDREHQRWVDL